MFAVLYVRSTIYLPQFSLVLGALKATGNRGLQPAMDHILEHEGQPIPDLGGVSEHASSSAMDVDNEDEDTEALRSLGVAVGNGNAVEAKVRVIVRGNGDTT